MKKNLTHTGDRAAAARFLLYSLTGIFLFFIQIRIGDSRSIPVDHLISVMKALLSRYYSWILLVLSVYSLVVQWKSRSEKKGEFCFFFVQAVFGVLFCIAAVTGIGPSFLQSAIRSAVSATGNILCAIFLSSLFIPLLVDYGLVDAMGVICRPVMRRVFLTPGSSAVIGVSAFLGNYSVGHVVSRQMYEDNRFTEKEMVIVATGFSTCSIGLMLNLVNYLDLMDYWGTYVLCILLITFLTTAVVARIYPISRKSSVCRDGLPAREEEQTERGSLFRHAWQAGVSRAAGAPGLLLAIRRILVRIFPVICGITTTSVFVIVCGTLLMSETGIFPLIGHIVWPILKLAGLSAADTEAVMSGIGISLMEPVLAGVVSVGKELSFTAKWILALVPYSGIIFFAGCIPSIRSSGIPCSIPELLLIWVERIVIGTVLAVCTAMLIG